MDTLITQDVYDEVELQPSPWSNVEGWCLANCFWDQLHVMWLGFARDWAASVLVEFFTHGYVDGPSEEDCYKSLTKTFKDWCIVRKIHCRCWFSKSSLGIHNNDYPEMASWFKAIHIKILCMWLADQCQIFHDGSEHADVRAVCAWSLARYTRVLDNADVILTEQESRSALKNGMRYLQTYQWLACRAHRDQLKLYRTRPKMHGFWHILEGCVQHRLNPVAVQCNDDESYMGTMKKIGKMCAGGAACMKAVLQRYRIALSIRLESRRRATEQV
jgi:hypothetical protein